MLRPRSCRTAFTRGTTRVARRYLYQIARRRTAFAKPYVWWVKEPLDVDAHAARRRAASWACEISSRSPRKTTHDLDVQIDAAC